MTDLLRFSASLALEAAADGGKKPRRLTIRAYDGKPMIVSGWGSVVVDLGGLALPSTVPILAAHANTLDSVVGQGRPSIINGELVLAVDLAPGAAAERVVELLQAGINLEASVGAEPTQRRFLQATHKAIVNGSKIVAPTGGIAIIEKSRLREISVLPVGANVGTSVSLAAKSSIGENMEPVVTNPPAPAVVRSEADILRAERERIGRIDRACSGMEGLPAPYRERIEAARAQAMTGDGNADQIDAIMLEFIRARRPNAPQGFVGNATPVVNDRNVLSAVLMVRSGYAAAAEQEFGAHVLEQSRPLHSASLVDLCRASLQSDHREIPHSRNEMIRAALSTGSMPYALGDSANKIMSAAYRSAPASWRQFAAVKNAANFHTQRAIRPSFFGDLEELAPGGEIKHGWYNEETFVWQIDTFAKQLKIDRQHFINDDLGVFAEIIPSMAKSSARTLSSLVVKAILANSGTFWGTGNLNYFEGSGTALSASSLASAIRLLRVQKDAEGNLLDLMPSVLLVPPELEHTAKALVASATLQRYVANGTDNAPMGNPFEDVATVVVEPRLSDSSFTGYSATAWYLFSEPSNAACVVGFLDGMERPTIEQFGLDHDVNSLSFAFRVYHDFGAALGDYRASVKSKGAA